MMRVIASRAKRPSTHKTFQVEVVLFDRNPHGLQILCRPRSLEGVVGRPVRVQIPPSAPSQYSKGIWPRTEFPFFVFWPHVAHMGLAGRLLGVFESHSWMPIHTVVLGESLHCLQSLNPRKPEENPIEPSYRIA
jgi:hypothetical protein